MAEIYSSAITNSACRMPDCYRERDLESKEQFWTLRDPEPETRRGRVCTLGFFETFVAACA